MVYQGVYLESELPTEKIFILLESLVEGGVLCQNFLYCMKKGLSQRKSIFTAILDTSLPSCLLRDLFLPITPCWKFHCLKLSLNTSLTKR